VRGRLRLSACPVQAPYRVRRHSLLRLAGAEERTDGPGRAVDRCKERVRNTEVDIQGAGRTDAGVHALHQVAHLEVRTMLAPEIIRMKVNDLLPPDINLLEVEKAPAEFHARHDARARRYLYRISRRRRHSASTTSGG